MHIGPHLVGLGDSSDKLAKPPQLSWYDHAITLLQIGASIEHALMVQYLYAAYSLRVDRPPADKWRKSLLTIAREEMGHLLTVQNILTLMGGAFNLNRGNYPWDVSFEACPFRLERLSRGSLACYVYAEMSPGDERKPEFEAIKREADGHLKKISENTRTLYDGQVRHVGILYDRVIRILGDRDKVPDVCFENGEIGQFSWDEWGRNYRGDKDKKEDPHDGSRANVLIRKVATREDALIALAELSEQGEGLVAVKKGLGDTDILRNLSPNIPKFDDSATHFDRFLKIYNELGDRDLDKFTWMVPDNPTIDTSASVDGKGVTPDGRTLITSTRSSQWAGLFNLRYRMLLAWLAHALMLVRGEPSASSHLCGQIVHRVFGEMYNIKAIAEMLVKMPLTDKSGDPKAGPPFEMPFHTSLPPNHQDIWEVHKAALAATRNLCRTLLPEDRNDSGSPVLETDPVAIGYLKAMMHADQDADRWIDSILGGLR
jgi:hypothetical protein